MVKINFPQSSEGFNSHTDYRGEEPYLSSIDAEFAAERECCNALSELVVGFSSSDFASAGLSSELPARYADSQAARERALALQVSRASRRPVAAYVIEAENRSGFVPVGMASFMRPDTKRHLVDERERVFTGWFDASRIGLSRPTSLEAFAFETLSIAKRMAREARLDTLSVQVVDEVSKEGIPKNPDLKVIEHIADLVNLGFEIVGDFEFENEGVTYPGVKWSASMRK